MILICLMLMEKKTSIHSTKNTNKNYTGKNEQNSGTKDENKFWIRKLLEVVVDFVLTTLWHIKEIKQ